MYSGAQERILELFGPRVNRRGQVRAINEPFNGIIVTKIVHRMFDSLTCYFDVDV